MPKSQLPTKKEKDNEIGWCPKFNHKFNYIQPWGGEFKFQFFDIIENFSGAVEWFDWSEELLKKCENQNRLHLSPVC